MFYFPLQTYSEIATNFHNIFVKYAHSVQWEKMVGGQNCLLGEQVPALKYPKKSEFFCIFFLCTIFNYFIRRPSDSTVSEDAGIEPRTVATTALAVRRALTARLDLIH